MSRAWHFGLGLNNYVLYSILWTFGPIRCVYEAELVLGLFFRHQDALSSYSVYLDAEWHNSFRFLGAQITAQDKPSPRHVSPLGTVLNIFQIFVVVRLWNL